MYTQNTVCDFAADSIYPNKGIQTMKRIIFTVAIAIFIFVHALDATEGARAAIVDRAANIERVIAGE